MVWDDVKVQWYYPWFGCFSICLSVLLLWHSAWLKACLAVAPSLFLVCTRFDIGLHVLIKKGLALVCTWFDFKVWHWFGLCSTRFYHNRPAVGRLCHAAAHGRSNWEERNGVKDTAWGKNKSPKRLWPNQGSNPGTPVCCQTLCQLH